MDFVADYVRWCGVSEAPTEYKRWCALAALAAVAEDKVWYAWGRTQIPPNLYVWLIGDSGTYKSQSISEVYKFVKPTAIRMKKMTSVTAAGLVDMLATSRTGGRPTGTKTLPAPDSKLWLMTGELSDALGSKQMSELFIRKMTDLYTGEEGLEEITRTHGPAALDKCVVNWLAGTTLEWMRDVVDSKMVEGGFFARVCTIVRKEDQDVRIPVPLYPPDADALHDALQAHLQAVAATRGEMVFEDEAEEMIRTWYKWRPRPPEKGQVAAWKRQHTLLRKLSVLRSLARGTSRIVSLDDAAAAGKLVSECARAHPALIDYVRSTPEMERSRKLRTWIKESGAVPYAGLTARAMALGIGPRELDQQVSQWIDAGIVTCNGSRKGTLVYAGKRTMPPAGKEEDTDV